MEIPEEIYGQILNKLSIEEAIKVAKSGSKLAKATLLYYPWDLSGNLCYAFKDIDLSVLLKNTSINRTNLFGCSVSLGDQALALKILSIAKNNSEKKEYQVNLGVDGHIIVDASFNGLTELVRVLLNVYGLNPSSNKNLAIKLAFKNGHGVIVDLLLESPKFNYDSPDLIFSALDYQAEDILIKIVERAKFKRSRSKWMHTIFERAVNGRMFNLVSHMIKSEKISTGRMQAVVADLVRTTKIVTFTRKIMKILVDKYHDDHNPGVYPQFILGIIKTSIKNRLSVFKMMMKETKIDPGYNNNILLRLAADTTSQGYLYTMSGINIVKYLITEYKDQVDPSIMNFRVFWTIYVNRHKSVRIQELLDVVIDHPRIKYNLQLDETVLSGIYKHKK